MAQFVATVDSSSEQRAQFAARATQELESFYGSAARTFERADLTLVSWTQSWEPFHQADSARGSTFIWGHAFERQRRKRSPPPDLAAAWASLPELMPPALEGIHAAFMCGSDASWTAGADILGVMPVYYWCGKDCVIVASSPELFRAHASFRAELDPKALAGILLTNGLVGGRALLRGVQRLAPGNLLHARRGQSPTELAQYRPEVSDRYFGASYEENFARMEQTLEACFERHAPPGEQYGLLLSGGLDSRLVVGIAQRRDIALTAFCFGSPRDIERRFYPRTMGFASPGWNAIRVAAEAHRKRALDATALAEVLPAPGQPLAVRDGIMDTSKMKLLTGFLLWSAHYL